MTDTQDIKCVFSFVCDKDWEDLEQTEQKSKRYCSDCARHVYRCTTEKQLERCRARRDCVCYEPSEDIRIMGGPWDPDRPKKAVRRDGSWDEVIKRLLG